MTEMRTFDWRPSPDPRSANFLMSSLDCYSSGRSHRSIRRRKAVFLDQGTEGACTGFSEEHVRALSPYGQKTSNAQAQAIYHRARELDEWPGEDYDGSSVNGAMKAAREAGYITSWRWCRTLGELRHALSFHGAVAAGTYWYSDMWDADENGFLHVSGQQIGGHAWALAGYEVFEDRVRFRMENSWGPSWGDNGGAWIWDADLLKLMAGDGEFAVPSKVRL